MTEPIKTLVSVPKLWLECHIWDTRALTDCNYSSLWPDLLPVFISRQNWYTVNLCSSPPDLWGVAPWVQAGFARWPGTPQPFWEGTHHPLHEAWASTGRPQWPAWNISPSCMKVQIFSCWPSPRRRPAFLYIWIWKSQKYAQSQRRVSSARLIGLLQMCMEIILYFVSLVNLIPEQLPRGFRRDDT